MKTYKSKRVANPKVSGARVHGLKP